MWVRRKNMILWTIQPKEVYEILLDKGIVICDINRSSFAGNDEDNKNAYKWMSDKMKDIIGVHESIEFPIWAWHTFDGKRKRPDLRKAGYANPKTECVCIEIEVPDDEVVLSDFDSWHNVLNNTFASMAENESDWDKEQLWLDSLSDIQRKEKIEESWDNIFKVNYFENDWIASGLYIQATFWELKKEYVKNVRYFIAR